MKDFTRLFDILPYQLATAPQKDALCHKKNGEWIKYSTEECVRYMNKVSQAFLKSGLGPGDKAAIISNNCPEWNFIDNGMMQVGVINVPIYPTISEADYRYIFNDAGVKIAFVSSEELFLKIHHIKDDVPTLQEIYSFDDISNCKNWKEFLALADEDMTKVNEISKQIERDQLATLIYTSGTTGTPKGVMLSHRNVVENVKATVDCLPLKSEHRTLSFLPLCHIFERMVIYTYLSVGSSVYYAESIETVGENLKEVKPHFFSTVPRLLEKVYDKIIAKGLALTGFKKKLFFWAVDLGLQYDVGIKDPVYQFKLKIADKLIFSKWREALGGNVIGVATGAAALQERLGRVFSAAGIAVREGYGQTESSPVLTFNRFDQTNVKFGTVGVPIPGVEIKLAENGEILAKGPNVMMGYYNKPDQTAETIDSEGWLHTGDVGKFVDGKFLKITDRVKELFKTSGGKYVAPQVIENKLKESQYIEQICVLGENQKFVSALIVPAFINVTEWCSKHAVAVKDPESMIASRDVQKLFQSEIEELNKNFGHVEQVKKFELMPREWSVDGGELTPTMKVKRKVIMEKYADVIHAIYN